MEVPDGYELAVEPRGRAVVRADVAAVPLATWWQPGEPLAGARGRGGVRVVEYRAGARGVARTYRRGGALRAFGDRFLGDGRAARELAALVALRRAGVPAVVPLAALSRRRGPFCVLRLVTELVEGALPLPAFAAARPQHARAAVREAGRVVRAAFEAGLFHPDLHPDNLLASVEGRAPRVRLLDLDRARIDRPLRASKRDVMLLRMARYLERHRADLPVAPRPVDVVRFLGGLGLGRGQRRAEIARLRPALARQVARHRLTWDRDR